MAAGGMLVFTALVHPGISMKSLRRAGRRSAESKRALPPTQSGSRAAKTVADALAPGDAGDEGDRERAWWRILKNFSNKKN